MALTYVQAGSILDKLLANPPQGSLKSLLYTPEHNPTLIPALHALVTETLKYKRVLDQVIKAASIKIEGYISYVMLYDLLLGKQKIAGGGRLKKELLTKKAAARSALVRIKVKAKVKENLELVPLIFQRQTTIPRYARCNLLLTTAEKVMSVLKSDGYHLVEEFKEEDTKCFSIDPDFTEQQLLVFPPMTDLHDHPLVLKGHLILQDKASMMSGYILQATPSSIAIDACAAPGMKTSQIAQSMENKGTLYAFDKDPNRLQTLKKLTTRNGLKNLTPLCQDFLTVDPNDPQYKDVQYILCDPSCSGSGIIGRMDDLIAYAGGSDKVLKNDTDEQEIEIDDLSKRLQSLSEFQYNVIMHAAKFPSVRIVYSTCSVHVQENEDVVLKALADMNGKFKLEQALPNWKRRGLISDPEIPFSDQLPNCIRTDPRDDKTIGFFVASFVKNDGSAPNQTRTDTPLNTTPASSVAVGFKFNKTPAKEEKITQAEEPEPKKLKKSPIEESQTQTNPKENTPPSVFKFGPKKQNINLDQIEINFAPTTTTFIPPQVSLNKKKSKKRKREQDRQPKENYPESHND